MPITVSDSNIIVRIAVLKAAGLIEADIDPPLCMTRPFGSHASAVVRAITDQGWAELDQKRITAS